MDRFTRTEGGFNRMDVDLLGGFTSPPPLLPSPPPSSANFITKDSSANCPILERALSSTPPGISDGLVKMYQTLLLQNMMDYLYSGNENILVMFQAGVLGVNVDRSLCGALSILYQSGG